MMSRSFVPSYMGTPMSTDTWTAVGEASALLGTGRLHTCVNGRLTCIDSICFHAGGPLALGDIEDVEGKPCLVCPWHEYKIDAFTGDKYYQSVAWQGGKMVPAGWKSNGPRHRVHQVEERSDGLLYVLLNTDPAEIASDEYAHNTACGSRLLCGPNSPAARSAAAVGADGKRVSRPPPTQSSTTRISRLQMDAPPVQQQQQQQQ